MIDRCGADPVETAQRSVRSALLGVNVGVLALVILRDSLVFSVVMLVLL